MIHSRKLPKRGLSIISAAERDGARSILDSSWLSLDYKRGNNILIVWHDLEVQHTVLSSWGLLIYARATFVTEERDFILSRANVRTT